MTRKRPFRVGRARTGLGLFATQAIRKRSRIVEYKGRKLPNDEAEKLEARGNRYLYEINSRWTVDGSSRRTLGHHANHSCRPNAESATACFCARSRASSPATRSPMITRRLPQQRDHSSRLQM
jgi:SET domain-containing protein